MQVALPRTTQHPDPGAALRRITETPILFALTAIVLLAVLWGIALNLIRMDGENARRNAARASAEGAEVYRSRVARALREIDHALKFVIYAQEINQDTAIVVDPASRALLLPDFLFAIRLTDATGQVIASSRTFGETSLANQDYFQAQRQRGVEQLFVGKPQPDSRHGIWQLHFSRRIVGDDGSFAGIAVATVNVDYFLSDDKQRAPEDNVLVGLVDADGRFLARRTGDTLTVNDGATYRPATTAAPPSGGEALPTLNTWDNRRRYLSAARLGEYPLAVVVGLSEHEQLLAFEQHKRSLLLRTAAASMVGLALIALLGRFKYQLERSRLRALEDQVEHAHRVEYLAYHDGLTGLPNRSHFSRSLRQGMSEAKRYRRQLATLFLDLDRFKFINDTLGHETGDALLQEVARRLRDAVRASDIVARLGGDEFVVLLPQFADEHAISGVAQKILAAIARPFTLLGQEFRVTASIGISLYPRDAEDEQSLIKAADIAMYHAKERGKNNFQFYSQQLNTSSLQRLALEASLRLAIERGEFRLHYQDKRNLLTGAITGTEALLRWQHPDLGLIPPLQFLPLAEETGLILPIGKWVIETACRHHIATRATAAAAPGVAVNLTARQLGDPDLLENLRRILINTGMDPGELELEITESALMGDLDRAVKILENIKALGVRVAIDNFGTSYSSLSTLKKFQFDTIKIDGSVIRDAETNDDDRSLTEAIIAMGKSLAFTVVAEGVETSAQARFLRERACDEVQGFYFSEPVALGSAPSPGRGHNDAGPTAAIQW